ncbi:Amine oxidase [Aphelenchoides fujianensis]|nr:Amine oxidase [Aphelenchoides fujianensis]
MAEENTWTNEDSNLTEPTAASSSNGADGQSEESSEAEAPITRELRSAKRTTVETIERTQLLENGSGDSREGSCEQSECSSDTECAGQFTPSCVSLPGGRQGRANYFHLSSTEHICFYCYEDMARVGRPKYDQYNAWKSIWVKESRCTPSLRLFVLDEVLPFWISCVECGKFRKCSADENKWDNETIAAFTCDQWTDQRYPCRIAEDKKVAKHECLHVSSTTRPLSDYLKEEYFLDELGISPTRSPSAKTPEAKAADFMVPFNIPTEPSIAFCVRPDGLEFDELEAFPEFTAEPVPFFAMRNLVVALWTLNPFEYLTFEKCLSYLICRGLARVWYATQLRRVYDFLCIKNIVNHGILPFPRQKILKERVKKHELEVVLTMNGAKVTVLEATDRCGGRMKDDHSLGVAVGCGAQLVTGVVNSPLILMCHQVNVGYRKLTDECPLLDATSGRVISASADRVVDEHFNCVLDAIGAWRKMTTSGDSSLLEKLTTFHKKLLSSLDFPWSPDYERILQWQLGNIEFSCGSGIDAVSARNWDQNEAVGQFAGDHAILCEGSGRIIGKLAEGSGLHLVQRVEYGPKKKAVVYCKNGKKFTCDKVLVCIPLAMYHRETIEFQPALPASKLKGLKGLGAGLIEKVAVRFPTRFWSSLLKKDGTLDYFGHIPKNDRNRGLFNMFYDFTNRDQVGSFDLLSLYFRCLRTRTEPHYVLMSYVCGLSVDLVNEKTDEEVVELFVDTLRALFPNEEIPEPIGHVVTHWGRDPHIGMSYSYVKVGASGEHYDRLAEPVQNRLYFAGECTNRFFPQTMTGAYVSGLREASRIAESWLVENAD